MDGIWGKKIEKNQKKSRCRLVKAEIRGNLNICRASQAVKASARCCSKWFMDFSSKREDN